MILHCGGVNNGCFKDNSHFVFEEILEVEGIYTKCDIWCHMVVNVTMVALQRTLLMNKWTNIVMDEGWVYPLAKTLPSLVNNLWWNIVMDDWNLDEKTLGKWQFLQHCKSIIPKKTYKEWQIILGLTFRVGDTIPRFTITIEQDN